MQKTDNSQLDAFLVDYLIKKDNPLGLSASNICHWNKNLNNAKVIGRLKALSNAGVIKMKKQPYHNSDQELRFVNVYFPKDNISKQEKCDAIHEDTQGLIRKDLLLQ